jgi:hypothetical protein
MVGCQMGRTLCNVQTINNMPMSTPESKLSPQALAAQMKEEQALDLRLSRHTFGQIVL